MQIISLTVFARHAHGTLTKILVIPWRVFFQAVWQITFCTCIKTHLFMILHMYMFLKYYIFMHKVNVCVYVTLCYIYTNITYIVFTSTSYLMSGFRSTVALRAVAIPPPPHCWTIDSPVYRLLCGFLKCLFLQLPG